MKLFNRWYLVVIILPFIVNLFSNSISLNEIKSNPFISSTVVLVLYSLIISFEFYRYYKKQTETISEHDKEVIKNLITTLNLKHVHESLYLQDAWYGYEQKHISGFINFTFEVKELVNRLSNKDLQSLFDEAVIAIEEFNELGSKKLFPHNDFYILNKNDERKETAKKLNILAQNAFNKIEILTIELKRKNLLSLSESKKPPLVLPV